jgi:two-component system chemotaxis response regulator CheY
MVALVVDDSAAMRRIQQMALEAHGWTVEVAATGEDALVKLGAIPRCDLLVTDWHMPGMGGLDLVKTVRRDLRFDHVRILMVTSDSVLSSIEQAVEAGANDFVMKPFSREALIERVSEVMAPR